MLLAVDVVCFGVCALVDTAGFAVVVLDVFFAAGLVEAAVVFAGFAHNRGLSATSVANLYIFCDMNAKTSIFAATNRSVAVRLVSGVCFLRPATLQNRIIPAANTQAFMIGTIANVCTIIIGSVAGSLARRGIKEKYRSALFNALGLACLVLGANTAIKYMPQSEYPVLFIASLAVGGLIGTVLDLDGRFKKATSKIGGSNLAEGLTTGCLLYCIGTLSMVGPVMSALFDDNTFLFTNAMLDLVTSTVLASTYGIGMLLAAPVLFCWQGTFYLIAKMSSSAISDALIAEVSIVGGVLIVCSGLSLLNIKDCHTLNLIPSLLVPVLFFAAKFLLF